MINFGFIFGFLLGIPVIFIVEALPYWWVLPICGVVVGWRTNLLGMQLIFEPVEPRRIGPFKMHGLFLRRRDEVADVYARDHRRGHRHPRQHRRPPALRAALGPHPPDAGDGAAPGGRPGDRGGPHGGPGGDGHAASTTRSATRSPPRPSTTR